MRRLRALTVVPVIGAVVLSGAGAAYGYTLPGIPSGTTGVTVHGGATTHNIDAAITPGAAIAGKLTSVTNGSALSGVYVQVFSSAGGFLGSAATAADGTYKVVSLPPSSTGFYVCANGDNASGGPSAYGYVHRCYGSTAVWNGANPPKSAKKVPTVAGVTKQHVNIALTSAGAITGKVSAGHGSALNSYVVEVFSAGRIVASTYAFAATYNIQAIPPGSYKVCFAGSQASGGPSKTGYLSECWNNKAWNGSSAPPSSAATVHVTAAHQVGGINAALSAAGAISGAVHTASSPHKPVTNSAIYVFSGNNVAGYGSTLSNGSYKVTGLRSGSYKVCAVTGSVAHSSLTYTKGQCWKGVAWTSGHPSSHASSVSVSAGRTHTGINLLLGHVSTPVGAIAGTVRSSSGKLLRNVNVTVYAKGSSSVNSGVTGAKGTYKISGLKPSSTGYVVCFGGGYATPSSGATPSTGYTNLCYRQVKWDLGAVPTHTTRISVKAGRTHTGVNAALGSAGGISGHIAYGSTPLAYVTVYVLNSHKQVVGSGYSDNTGAYTVKGLTPESGYITCFATRSSFDTSASTTGYRGQCYKRKAWDGSPNFT